MRQRCTTLRNASRQEIRFLKLFQPSAIWTAVLILIQTEVLLSDTGLNPTYDSDGIVIAMRER